MTPLPTHNVRMLGYSGVVLLTLEAGDVHNEIQRRDERTGNSRTGAPVSPEYRNSHKREQSQRDDVTEVLPDSCNL